MSDHDKKCGKKACPDGYACARSVGHRGDCRPHCCLARHWFTVHGIVGLRSPLCRRCGTPNPRPLTPDEQANYDFLMDAEHAGGVS